MSHSTENGKKEGDGVYFNKNVQEAQQEYMDAIRDQNRQMNRIQEKDRNKKLTLLMGKVPTFGK